MSEPDDVSSSFSGKVHTHPCDKYDPRTYEVCGEEVMCWDDDCPVEKGDPPRCEGHL